CRQGCRCRAGSVQEAGSGIRHYIACFAADNASLGDIMRKDKDRQNNSQQKRPLSRRNFLMAPVAGAAAFSIIKGTSASAQQRGTIGETGLQGGERGVYPGQTPATARVSQGKKLRDLLARKNVVLPVLGVPDAAGAVKMEAAGCECA